MTATLLNLLRLPSVERLGWTLLHFVWQGAAIAAIYGIALVAQRRHSAAARYLAGCLAMLLMALAPIMTFFSIGQSQPPVTARSRITAPAITPLTADTVATSVPQ